METWWRIRKRKLHIKKFLIMGIVNATPDSFYGGSRYPDMDRAAERAMEMVREGADIIDIGGESTRPGSEKVSESEEIERVLPLVKYLSGRSNVILSCDTCKHGVAEKAIEAGVSVINDISAFSLDERLFDVIKDTDCGYVLMHMQGTPADMQKNPFYMDAVAEVYGFLDEKTRWMQDNGISPDRVVIDPGIGFGKRLQDNLEILGGLDRFRGIGRPVLVGASRKSFIGSILGGLPPEERLEGALAAAVAAYMKGVSVFRVHDVKETRRALEVAACICGPQGFTEDK